MRARRRDDSRMFGAMSLCLGSSPASAPSPELPAPASLSRSGVAGIRMNSTDGTTGSPRLNPLSSGSDLGSPTSGRSLPRVSLLRAIAGSSPRRRIRLPAPYQGCPPKTHPRCGNGRCRSRTVAKPLMTPRAYVHPPHERCAHPRPQLFSFGPGWRKETRWTVNARRPPSLHSQFWRLQLLEA